MDPAGTEMRASQSPAGSISRLPCVGSSAARLAVGMIRLRRHYETVMIHRQFFLGELKDILLYILYFRENVTPLPVLTRERKGRIKPFEVMAGAFVPMLLCMATHSNIRAIHGCLEVV